MIIADRYRNRKQRQEQQLEAQLKAYSIRLQSELNRRLFMEMDAGSDTRVLWVEELCLEELCLEEVTGTAGRRTRRADARRK